MKLLKRSRKMRAVGSCRALCHTCRRVLPHHVVRRFESYSVLGLPVFEARGGHSIICARCQTHTPLQTPEAYGSRSLKLTAT